MFIQFLIPTTSLDRKLEKVIGLTLVLNLIDAILTIFVVGMGLAIEKNPLMNGLLSRSPVLFVVVKLLLVSFGVILLWRFRHSRMAIGGIFFVFSTYVLIFLWHIHGLGQISLFIS
jgi:hypothetical protein